MWLWFRAWMFGGTSARWQYDAHASPPAMTGTPRDNAAAAGATGAYNGLIVTFPSDEGTVEYTGGGGQ